MTTQPGAAPPSDTGTGPAGEPFDPVGVTWSRVSPRLAVARRLFGVAVGVPLLLTAGALGTWADRRWWAAAVVPVVAAGWWWWLSGRQVRAIGYAERDDDLLVRRGIMWRSIVVVPYGRLQYVDVQAGPIDRLCGIARVQLHTASAATDARIPGLLPAQAAHVRDRLAARGQARLAGL